MPKTNRNTIKHLTELSKLKHCYATEIAQVTENKAAFEALERVHAQFNQDATQNWQQQPLSLLKPFIDQQKKAFQVVRKYFKPMIKLKAKLEQNLTSTMQIQGLTLSSSQSAEQKSLIETIEKLKTEFMHTIGAKLPKYLEIEGYLELAKGLIALQILEQKQNQHITNLLKSCTGLAALVQRASHQVETIHKLIGEVQSLPMFEQHREQVIAMVSDIRENEQALQNQMQACCRAII